VRSQRVVGFVVEAFDSRGLARFVNSRELIVSPRVVGRDQAALDPIGSVGHAETHWPEVDGVTDAGLLGDLDAVIGGAVDPIGHAFQQMLEEIPGRRSVSRYNELSYGEFSRSVNFYKEIEFIFSRLQLGNVDMKQSDRLALELLALGLVALDISNTEDAMPLQTPMQCRTG
jgi:hypothetical protein